jgi:lysophospholipase L1-like esterase
MAITRTRSRRSTLNIVADKNKCKSRVLKSKSTPRLTLAKQIEVPSIDLNVVAQPTDGSAESPSVVSEPHVPPANKVISKPLKLSDFVKSKHTVRKKKARKDLPDINKDTPETEKQCMPFCRYYGDVSEEMICCYICLKLHRYQCVNIQDSAEIPKRWNCPLCRRMPEVVRELSSRITSLEQTNIEQSLMITELLRIIRKFDMNDEQVKLIKIGHTVETKSPSTNFSNLPDLLIGSSILKETASKDKSVHIRSKGGAKIRDVKRMLQNITDSSYMCTTLQIGGNDCSTCGNVDEILTSYDELITEAKRVSQQVRISSICPRTRNLVEDSRIRSVNGKLKQLAEKRSCLFVDNDKTFRYQNGTVDTTTLQSDGVHLTANGVKRLLDNLGLFQKVQFRRIADTKKTNSLNHKKPNHATYSQVVQNKKPDVQHHQSINHPAAIPACANRHIKYPVTMQQTQDQSVNSYANFDVPVNRHMAYQPSAATGDLQVPSETPRQTVIPLNVPPPSFISANNHSYSLPTRGAREINKLRHTQVHRGREDRHGSPGHRPVAVRNHSRPAAQITCHNCGVQGHVSKYCRLTAPVKCYTCGNSGHKASYCAMNEHHEQYVSF